MKGTWVSFILPSYASSNLWYCFCFLFISYFLFWQKREASEEASKGVMVMPFQVLLGPDSISLPMKPLGVFLYLEPLMFPLATKERISRTNLTKK